MNFKRGIKRVALVVSVLFSLFVMYITSQEIMSLRKEAKKEYEIVRNEYHKECDPLCFDESYYRLSTLDEFSKPIDIITFRLKYPEYDDLADEELSKRLYEKFYKSMSYDDFQRRFINNEQSISAVEINNKSLSLAGRKAMQDRLIKNKTAFWNNLSSASFVGILIILIVISGLVAYGISWTAIFYIVWFLFLIMKWVLLGFCEK